MRLSCVAVFLLATVFCSGQSAYAGKRSQRIVSLSPHATEMIFAMGAGGELVGVSSQCDFPPDAQKKIRVGDTALPSIEKVLSLKPDLVVASELNPRHVLESLKKAGIRVHLSAPQNIVEVANDMRTLGKGIGVFDKADSVAGKLEKAIREFEDSGAKRLREGRNRALVLVQVNPPIAAAPGSWLGDILARGGYANIVTSDSGQWPRLSREFLYTQNIDFVFVDRGAVVGKHSEDEIRSNTLSLWKGRSALPRVVVLPPDVLMRPGPRIVEGLRFLQSVK